MASGREVILVTEARDTGEGFPGNDGTYFEEIELTLSEPLQGYKVAKTFVPRGKGLFLDELEKGPVEVEWETKSNRQGAYLKVKRYKEPIQATGAARNTLPPPPAAPSAAPSVTEVTQGKEVAAAILTQALGNLCGIREEWDLDKAIEVYQQILGGI